MAAVVIDFAVRNGIDGVVGPGSWLVIGTVGPFLVGAMAVGTGHGVREHIMIPASWQAMLDVIIVVRIIVLDQGSATAVTALVIGGLRFHHDLLAGGIGDGGAAARIRVGGIRGIAAREHGCGGEARTAVDLFAPPHATQKVLVIGHGRPPTLGTVVVVHGQVIGRADRPDLRKALVLGMVIVLPVRITTRQPVVANAILISPLILIGVTKAIPAIGPCFCQPVVAKGGFGRLQGGRAAIGAESGHAGDHLLSPGIIIRMRVMACAGAIVGAEERIVAVVGDGRSVLDSGSAMGIVIGSGIRDLPTHPGIEILVEIEIVPGGLRAIGLRPDRLCTVVVRVCEQRRVVKLDAVQLMGYLILIDGGGDAHEVMLPCAILLRKGQRVRAGFEWGICVWRGRIRGVREGIAGIEVTRAGACVGAYIAAHTIQGQCTHHEGSLFVAQINWVITA